MLLSQVSGGHTRAVFGEDEQVFSCSGEVLLSTTEEENVWVRPLSLDCTWTYDTEENADHEFRLDVAGETFCARYWRRDAYSPHATLSFGGRKLRLDKSGREWQQIVVQGMLAGRYDARLQVFSSADYNAENIVGFVLLHTAVCESGESLWKEWSSDYDLHHNLKNTLSPFLSVSQVRIFC